MTVRINLIPRKTVRERVWKTLNVVVGITTILNVSMVGALIAPQAASAAGNPSADLDQCANGGVGDSPITCAGTAWQNGNLNGNQAHYYEGDSVPYRMRFENLSLGSHTVTIEWDTTQGGKHALDYLTSFDRTETTADPCSGVVGCGSPSTFGIPVDPNVTGNGVTPIAGNFTLYNGTITAASVYTLSGSYVGNSQTKITLTFTASNDHPVLAWGGHIATRDDWGQANSAIAISGSPYHMRLIDLDGSGGNQDRSLAAAAVVFPGSVTVVKQASPEGSQSFPYTTNLGSGFSLVDDGTIANTKVFSDIIDFTDDNTGPTAYTVTESAVAGWTLDSVVCVDPTSNSPGNTGTRTATIELAEGENITCTFTNSRQAGLVTFEKIVNGGTAQPSDWTFTVDGVQGSFNSGDSTTLPTGSYTVHESGPADYTASNVSGICSNLQGTDATLNVTTQGGTCTFTNVRDEGNLTLIKHVVNDNGGNNPASNFTMHIKQNGSDVVTPFAGSEGGNTFALPTGSYTVNETNLPSGYTQTGIVCDGQATNTVSVVAGQTKVCTITNNDVTPTITLNKVVINNNGGNAGVNDFGLTIGSTNVDSGDTLNVDANTPIALNEAGLAGYSFVSITGDAKCPEVLNGTVTLNESENVTCTITNHDIAPTITLNKVVTNNNGGTAGVNDFGLTIGGTPVVSGQTLNVNANSPIALNEAGLAGYSFVSITGNAKCPAVLNGTVTLNEGENVTCTITNDDIQPKLTVTKVVINDNGGTKVISDFPLFVNGGSVVSGVQNGFNAGDYTVSETNLPGYTATITGDCDAQGDVSLGIGDVKACTITNDDIQPKLTVTKVVINNNGGTKVIADFSLFVSATAVTSGVQNNFNAGAYTVNEINLPGYAATISGDCAVNGTITLNPGDVKACVITNDDIQPKLTVIKNVNNDFGGTAVPGDFTINVSGTNVAPNSFAGSAAGTLVALDQGAYNVTENLVTGYSPVYSANCTGTINVGEEKTCIVTNSAIQPLLLVIKHVVNDNGGNNVAGDFTMNVTGTNASPSSFPGSEIGTFVTINIGAYSVDEGSHDGYIKSLSPDCVGTIALGELKVCTITNDDIAPTITLNKVVINNNGGNADMNDFGLTIGGTAVTSGQVLPVLANTTYGLNEAGLSGYTFVSLTGDAKCPAVLNGTVTLNEGENVSCTITNDDVAPTITLNKVVINNNGGNAGINDFGLTIGGTAVTSGQALAVNANTTYALNEAGLSGYTFVSLTGDNECPELLNGTVTLDEGRNVTCTITNDDVAPTITLNKVVINNNGGNAGSNDFGLTIGGNNVNSGDTVSVDANSPIALNEAGLSGYSFVSLTGDAKCPAVLNGTVTLDEGENLSCTITNDDIAPTITLIKNVINNNGGTAGVNEFGLTIGGTGVASGQTLPVMANTPIALNEAGKTGYAFVSMTEGQFEEDRQTLCPTTLGGTTSLLPGQNITCIITNDDIQPKLTVTKVVINDNGGTKVVADFPLFVNAGSVISGVQNGFNAGAYTVSETNLAGYAATISGDCAANGSITLGVGDVKSCTITNNDIIPVLSITKSNDVVGFTNPGKQVNYTISVTNATTATDIAKNVVINDTLPAGFTFADTGLATKSTNAGDLAIGQTKVFTYLVNISATQVAGTFINTASAKGDNTLTVTATSPVEVRVPSILGVELEPTLVLTKTVDIGVTNPGKTVTYTVTISNPGDLDVTNIRLSDKLPPGFVFADTGLDTKTWDLGTLKAHHQRVLNYLVKITDGVKAGKYDNLATVLSNELDPITAKATVEVKVPQVLGLATTGASARDYLLFTLGFGLMTFGLYWVARLRRHDHGTDLA